jgi:broad specificity phosphatase PhoE
VTAAAGKRLVLVRHGQTEWSRDGRHTGRTDVPLTPLGRNQARQLGRRLLLLHIAPVRVLASPRERAVETARLAGFANRVEVTESLAELDYGDYEGRTSDDIRAQRSDWDLFRDGTPGGETLEQAGARADALLTHLDPDQGEGDVALFGHGHFLRVLAARYLGAEPAAARNFCLDTASISLLGHEHWWRCIRAWNQI